MYHRDTVGLVPEYFNKENSAIEWVTQFFGFPVHSLLCSVKCEIALCLRKQCT